MRRLPLAATLATVMALSACHEAARQPSSTAPTVTIGEGKLALPAVKGNPGAAYFTLANGSSKAVRLAAVDVDGAGMAMFHETMDMGGHSTMQDMKAPEVKPGETVSFAPGGKHVMVDGVPASLAPGASVRMTITLEDGAKVEAPLAVVAPGGAN